MPCRSIQTSSDGRFLGFAGSFQNRSDLEDAPTHRILAGLAVVSVGRRFSRKKKDNRKNARPSNSAAFGVARSIARIMCSLIQVLL